MACSKISLHILALGILFYSVLTAAQLPSCTLKSPLPTEYRCGFPVKVTENFPEYTEKGQYAPVETCAEWCNQQHSQNSDPYYDLCNLIARNNNTGLCYFPYDYAKQTQDNTSSVLLWDIQCFDCPANCPDLSNSASNLFGNPGFELSNLTGPWISTDQSFQVVSPGYNSSNAVKAKTNKGNGLVYELFLCRSDFYQLEMDFKVVPTVSNPTLSPQLSFSFSRSYESNTYILDSTNFEGFIGDWNHYKTIVQPKSLADPDATYLLIQVLNLNSKATGNEYEIYIDNLVLKKVKNPLSLKTVGDSLVKNGNFENGKVKPWELVINKGPKKNQRALFIATPGLKGSKYALEISALDHYGDAHGQGYGYSEGRVTLEQDTKTTTDPSKYYRVSFDYFLVDDSDTEIEFNGFNLYRQTQVSEYYHGVQKKTKTIVAVVRGTGKVDNLQLQFHDLVPYKKMVSSEIYLDNIDIRQIADGQF